MNRFAIGYSLRMCARHVDSTNPGRSNHVFRSKPIPEAEMSNRLIGYACSNSVIDVLAVVLHIKLMGVRRGWQLARGHFPLWIYDFFTKCILTIIAFNNKWLHNYQNDLENVKHIKILTILALLFLFSTPSLVPVTYSSNFLLKYFSPLQKFLRTPMIRL